MDDDREGSGRRVNRRVGEDRAAAILEAAAALDARRSTEIEVDQLREAAAGAGISREAFDEALREHEPAGERQAAGGGLAPADFAYHAAALRDVLGDEGRVTVVGDVIEWRDDDGIHVTLRPSSRTTTAAISAAGRLRRRLMAAFLGGLVPLLVSFMLIFVEDDFIGLFLGVVIALVGALVGVSVSHVRESRNLKKKTELTRRQLHRLLEPGPGAGTGDSFDRGWLREDLYDRGSGASAADERGPRDSPGPP